MHDHKPLTAKQQQLVKQFWDDYGGRVVKIAASKMGGRFRRFLDLGFDEDDINSIVLDGVIDAAQRYDPARGVAFKTYAVWRVQASMTRALTRELRQPVAIPEHGEPVEPYFGNYTPIDERTRATVHRKLERVLEKLQPRERRIADGILEGRPVEELGKPRTIFDKPIAVKEVGRVIQSIGRKIAKREQTNGSSRSR